MLGRVRDFNGEWLSARSEDLSEGGVRLCVDIPLLEGSPVDVELRLPRDGNGSDVGTLFCSRGEVVWCTEDMDVGFQAGIRFSPAPAETVGELRSFLSSVAA